MMNKTMFAEEMTRQYGYKNLENMVLLSKGLLLCVFSNASERGIKFTNEDREMTAEEVTAFLSQADDRQKW